MSPSDTPLLWVGPSHAALCSFSKAVQGDIGHQLRRVQKGMKPNSFERMATVGVGAYEIRITVNKVEFRCIYVERYDDAIYALHVFEKHGRKTSKPDLELAKARYAAMKKSRGE